MSQSEFNFSKNYFLSDEQNIFFEINNLGDPLLFLMPQFVSSENALFHSSQKVRKIDFLNNIPVIRDTSNTSHLSYTNSNNEGGFLKSYLKRPIGETSIFQFIYNNLSSEGFYNNQLNNSSNLSLYFDFFSKKKPYNNSFYFNSINANYQLNGGLKNYQPNISSDLINTYLDFATANIRKREFRFLQSYLFQNDLLFQHKLYFSQFQRDYTDTSPSSFYYTLSPLDPLILNYNLYTFCNTLDNEFSVLYKKLDFSINHIYYNTNNLHDNSVNGDIFFSFGTDENIQTKLKFNISYSPLGYSKNNYSLKLDYKKNNTNLSQLFSFNLLSKRPSFFNQHYNNSLIWDWNSFNDIKQLTIRSFSFFNSYNLIADLYFNRSVNYFYFNNLAHPVQSFDPILYFKVKFIKIFSLRNLSFNSLLYLQYSNNDILSVPLLLFNQEIVYKKSFTNDISLSTKLKGVVFSKYYPNSFFPLTDVFYQQRNVISNIMPFLSGSIYISKNNFSIGCVFDHLSSLLYNDSFYVPLYTLPQPVLRLSVKWSFID